MKALLLILGAVLLFFPQRIAWAKNEIEVNPNLLPDKEFSDELVQNVSYRGIDWSPVNGVTYDESDVMATRHPYVSPDKRFSIQVRIIKYEFVFFIHDATNGKTIHYSSLAQPLFFLDWSPDSKSFIVVGHAAHTSYLELDHWNGKKWVQSPVNIPGDEDVYNTHVVNWKFKPNHIEATYIADDISDNRQSLVHFFRYTFHIDPSTGKTSAVIKSPLSRSEYASLRTSRN